MASPDEKSRSQHPPRQAGIGTALRIDDGHVFVNKVLPESPAARSNLINANDQIVAVAEGNEEPIGVVGIKEVSSVVGMIRGPAGTVVRLTIIPEGMDDTDQLVVSLIRGDIKEIDSFIDGRLLPLGSKAPDFKFVPLGDGDQRNMSQLSGRVIVVEFWASWCGPCIKTVDELVSLHEQHPEWSGQVELLAVSVDERKQDAVSLYKSKPWSKISTVWAGPEVLRMYRVAGLPTTFVIDRDGTVAAVDHRVDVPVVIKQLLLRSAGKTGSH
jgi:thiol-disulfide isomerase/thioredoxin